MLKSDAATDLIAAVEALQQKRTNSAIKKGLLLRIAVTEGAVHNQRNCRHQTSQDLGCVEAVHYRHRKV